MGKWAWNQLNKNDLKYLCRQTRHRAFPMQLLDRGFGKSAGRQNTIYDEIVIAEADLADAEKKEFISSFIEIKGFRWITHLRVICRSPFFAFCDMVSVCG